MNFKTNEKVLLDLLLKLESGKLVEFTKEDIRKIFLKLKLKDNFNMKDVVYDLQKVFGENSVNMRGKRRWTFYTLSKSISKNVDQKIKDQLQESIQKEVEKKKVAAIDKQAKIEEKAAKAKEIFQQEQQEKEKLVDPVRDYCSAMGIDLKDMNPEVIKRFPKPVKKGEEYKHNDVPSKKDLKNCAIFLHNIKDLLKPGKILTLNKEEKWKATKGTSADFFAHLFVCYIYRFPTADFNVTNDGKVEISHLTKEDCEIIINNILDDLEGDPVQSVINTYIKNNRPLTFEETIIPVPEQLEKVVEKVKIQKELIPLEKEDISKIIFNLEDSENSIESMCNKTNLPKDKVEAVMLYLVSLGILSESYKNLISENNEDAFNKLMELQKKYEIKKEIRKRNITIISRNRSTTLDQYFSDNMKKTKTQLGQLNNGLYIYNVIVDIDDDKDIESIGIVWARQEPNEGEQMVLPEELMEVFQDDQKAFFIDFLLKKKDTVSRE